MLRRLFLWLSERRSLFAFAKRNGLARRIATRFVSGETLDTAIQAGRALNAAGMTVSLDLLGESVTNPDEARSARDDVVRIIEGLAQSAIRGNVSVKLTPLGLDIDRELCTANMRAVLTEPRDCGIFVRIDMEGSAYTDPTLDLFHRSCTPSSPTACVW